MVRETNLKKNETADYKQDTKGPNDSAKSLEQILIEAFDKNNLQMRGRESDELAFMPNKQNPFTGWVKVMYPNGQVKELTRMQNGKPNGRCTVWYKNGQIMKTGNTSNGAQNGFLDDLA